MKRYAATGVGLNPGLPWQRAAFNRKKALLTSKQTYI